MGHALPKPATQTTDPRSSEARTTDASPHGSRALSTPSVEQKTIESQNGNKVRASMTTKKPEALPLSGETSSSFGLLSELHSDLQVVLELLEKHDVRDFRLEKGDERIALKRGKDEQFVSTNYAPAPPSSPGASHPVVTPVNGATGPSSHVSAAPAAPEVSSSSSANPVVPNKTYKEVTSPMVGTFYRRPAVDAEPYVEVGDVVKKGDVLCIVEAMKLMNEIESELSGRVVEVCLDDAQMVEYGEVLFRIEPV